MIGSKILFKKVFNCKPLLIIFLFWLIRNLFFYFPFYSQIHPKIIFNTSYIKKGMDTIYGAYDFSHFFTVAETKYDTKNAFFENTGINPISVVIVKFPLYPLISLVISNLSHIRLDIMFVLFNNLISLLLAFLIYKYLQYLKFSPKISLFTAIFSLFFPARWAMYQLIPSADMLSAFLLLSFLISYKTLKKYSIVSLGLFILSRPNAFIIIFPLILDLVRQIFSNNYSKKLNKDKLFLCLLNTFTGISVFCLICLFYYFKFQNPFIFLFSRLPGHYTFFVKEFIPNILFYGLGSDNLSSNAFLLLAGSLFLLLKKEYFLFTAGVCFLLPLFFYTNDVQRYSFIIYPLLLFPIIGLLVSSLKITENLNLTKLFIVILFFTVISFTSAKYFWYTVSNRGYQDPAYPIIKNVYLLK